MDAKLSWPMLRESHQPGIEPVTCKWQVQRPTAKPPRTTDDAHTPQCMCIIWTKECRKDVLVMSCLALQFVTVTFKLDSVLSANANRQGVDISVTVCVCVCVFVFCVLLRLRISPPRIKLAASNFCTVVHWRPRQGISHFGELCSLEAQNQLANRPACALNYK